MANLTNSNKLIEKIDNLNVVRVSNTAPSNPTLWMAWYDSTSSSKMLKIYNGTSWDIVWPEMIPITQDAYDALSPAEKNNWKYYLITDAEGTIIVNWEDIVWAPTIPENTSDLNNDSWFITWINSSDVTTALWFTPYNASNPSWYQTASQVSSAINTALGSVYRYKWSKTTYSQLPTSWQITWDVWNIEQADSEHWIKAWDNVAWNGSAWDVLSWTVDLTNYFNKTTDNSDSITQWSNNLFLTWAERTKLGNLSWTNTWDETTATIKTKLWAASASQDWYLKKEDFATFNWKQDVLTAWDWISIENNIISSTPWKQSYFKTQDEYDALPASKKSDWNLYIIVDDHFRPISYEELIQLTPAPDAILTELDTYPKDYAEYYYENDDIEMDEMPSSVAPRPDAYWKMYEFEYDNYLYWYLDSNLTEQEITNMFPGFSQDVIDAMINWEWFAVDQWW